MKSLAELEQIRKQTLERIKPKKAIFAAEKNGEAKC